MGQGFVFGPGVGHQQNDGSEFGNNSPDIFGNGTPPMETNDYNFGFNSVPAPLPPATPRSFSSSSSPQSPPFPWSSSDDNVISTGPTCTALTAVPQPCSCLPAFFSAMTTLRAPTGPPDSFSLPSTLTVVRTTLTTITTSMHCRYCHFPRICRDNFRTDPQVKKSLMLRTRPFLIISMQSTVCYRLDGPSCFPCCCSPY
jgi:hypothetical protein